VNFIDIKSIESPDPSKVIIKTLYQRNNERMCQCCLAPCINRIFLLIGPFHIFCAHLFYFYFVSILLFYFSSMQ